MIASLRYFVVSILYMDHLKWYIDTEMTKY